MTASTSVVANLKLSHIRLNDRHTQTDDYDNFFDAKTLADQQSIESLEKQLIDTVDFDYCNRYIFVDMKHTNRRQQTYVDQLIAHVLEICPSAFETTAIDISNKQS